MSFDEMSFHRRSFVLSLNGSRIDRLTYNHYLWLTFIVNKKSDKLYYQLNVWKMNESMVLVLARFWKIDKKIIVYYLQRINIMRHVTKPEPDHIPESGSCTDPLQKGFFSNKALD